MLIFTGIFLCAFKDFDDSALIQESNYSRIDDIDGLGKSADDGVAYLDSFHTPIDRTKKTGLIIQKSVSVASSDRKIPVIIHNDARSMVNSNKKAKVERKKVQFEQAILDKEKEQEIVMASEMELMKSRKRVSKMSATEVIWNDSARRNLILLNAIAWSVKVIDWMLFSIWVETPLIKGGMGFSTFETGAISLLCFPCVSFMVLACFDITKRGLHSNWLIYTTLSMFLAILAIPLLKLTPLQHESLLFVVIIICSIKEGSYLIWISTWSQLMSRLFPRMMLGRIYSWSYFFGHLMLCFTSQIYPRGLTFFMENNLIIEYLKSFRFIVFFFILGIPLILSIFLTVRVRKVIKFVDNFTI